MTISGGTEKLPGQAALEALLAAESENVRFADDIAESVEAFVDALKVIAAEADPAPAVSLLLLQVSQISLTGARIGAHPDYAPREEYQPDVGPEADLDDLRMGLAALLADVDTYSFVFDPYDPEVVESQLSDDLTSIAADLENGLLHHRNGDVGEALWWWQYSYVNNWGNLAGAVLNALLMIIAHDRLDVEITSEQDLVEAAAEALS